MSGRVLAAGFAHQASGPLLLAMVVSALAGLVSFASPCVLPLVPGYLSFVTGLSGAEAMRRARGRVLAGAALFVLGFSAVFISTGALFGFVGVHLRAHSVGIERVLGVVAIVLGFAFIGALPFFARDLRLHRLPAVGLAGAPVLGVLFGLGWSPCVGPTLGVVIGLAAEPRVATAARGALLTACYCAGLGVPFLLVGLAFQRAVGAVAFVRRNSRWVTRAGGVLLVVIGVLLVAGLWDRITIDLQQIGPGVGGNV